MATTLEMLLTALNRRELPPVPDPAAPVPMFPAPAPPVTVGPAPTMPDLPPTAPAPALDMGFVNQFAGPAPARPVLDEPTTLDKIAAVLGGIAGGPGYGLALREERNRPIREYQAALERFNNRRTQGLEIATRKQEREQERTQRQAEAQAEREFNVWLKRTGVTDQMAVEQMRNAFEIEKIRERERVADERLGQQQKSQQERDARLIARDFGKVGAKPEVALQLGRYYSGLIDEISPEAAKFESAQARLAEIRARRAAAGGSGGGKASSKALKAAEEIQSIKDRMVEAEARDDQQTVKQLMMRARTAIRNSARFPEIEAGFDQSGKWPYVKIRTAQGSVALPGYGEAQPTAQAGPTMAIPPPETVQNYMQRWGITDRNQAIRELMGQQ